MEAATGPVLIYPEVALKGLSGEPGPDRPGPGHPLLATSCSSSLCSAYVVSWVDRGSQGLPHAKHFMHVVACVHAEKGQATGLSKLSQ